MSVDAARGAAAWLRDVLPQCPLIAIEVLLEIDVLLRFAEQPSVEADEAPCPTATPTSGC